MRQNMSDRPTDRLHATLYGMRLATRANDDINKRPTGKIFGLPTMVARMDASVDGVARCNEHFVEKYQQIRHR